MALATGNLRFCTGLLFLSRASVGSDANGHTTVGSLWVEVCSPTSNFVTNVVGKSRKIPFSFTDITHCHESFVPAFSLV